MDFNFFVYTFLLSCAYFTAGVQPLEYLGCYRDNVDRVLPDIWINNMKDNSPSICIDICYKLGFKLAGVQARRQCFCGNNIPSTKINEDQCAELCPKETSVTCGGGWANSIYRTADLTRVLPGEYLGCYRDNVDRVLPDIWVNEIEYNSPSICIDICYKLGFKLAGVQAVDHCFCGNNIPSTKINEDQCALSCPKDSTLKCGGLWANSVYRTADLRPATGYAEGLCKAFMNLKDFSVVPINGNSCQYRCINKLSKRGLGLSVFKKDGDVCNNGNGFCLKGVCQEPVQNSTCPGGFYAVRDICKMFCYSFNDNPGMSVVMSIQDGEICLDEQDYPGICFRAKCVINLEDRK